MPASATVASLRAAGQSILDALAGASVPILILALIVGQSPRFAGALRTSQAALIPIACGRLTLLEFAITFVNLAVPSTAARVGVNIRFFQRNGLVRTMAIAIGGVDSASAMGAALCSRMSTFYIPPCFGYFAMKSLRRQRML